MTLNEYQEQSYTSAQYPAYAEVIYPLMGLLGEAGELTAKFFDAMWPYGRPVPDGQEPYRNALLAVIGACRQCEVLKKGVRGGTAGLTTDDQAAIHYQIAGFPEGTTEGLINECGDCFWYLSALLKNLRADLDDVAKDNLRKLAARKAKGLIHSHQPDSQDHREGA